MNSAKIPRNQFAKALKHARKLRQLSQEDFGLVSSRTYVSTLERGLKSPTLSKIDELAAVLSLHPLTLLTLAYASRQNAGAEHEMLTKVAQELAALQHSA